MAVHPAVKNVLVIGAGDGGVIRELTRYPEIEHIDLVEIDELVVEVCKKYLPKTSCRLDDPRLSIHYEDGVRFVRSCEDKYDLIIVDSTDPFGPGEGLFTREFYGSCFKALHEDGIMVNQHESPFYPADAGGLPESPQADCGIFPHQPRIPGSHSYLPVRPLAVRLRLQEIPSAEGSEGGCLESERPFLQLLYHHSSQGSLLSAGLCRADVREVE